MGQDGPVSVLNPIKYPVSLVTGLSQPNPSQSPPPLPGGTTLGSRQLPLLCCVGEGQAFCSFRVESWFSSSGPSFSTGHPRGSVSATFPSCSGILGATPPRGKGRGQSGTSGGGEGALASHRPRAEPASASYWLCVGPESARDQPALVFFF